MSDGEASFAPAVALKSFRMLSSTASTFASSAS